MMKFLVLTVLAVVTFGCSASVNSAAEYPDGYPVMTPHTPMSDDEVEAAAVEAVSDGKASDTSNVERRTSEEVKVTTTIPAPEPVAPPRIRQDTSPLPAPGTGSGGGITRTRSQTRGAGTTFPIPGGGVGMAVPGGYVSRYEMQPAYTPPAEGYMIIVANNARGRSCPNQYISVTFRMPGVAGMSCSVGDELAFEEVIDSISKRPVQVIPPGGVVCFHVPVQNCLTPETCSVPYSVKSYSNTSGFAHRGRTLINTTANLPSYTPVPFLRGVRGAWADACH